MNVWFAIPSKRPAPEADATLALWRERGYRIAVFRDAGDEPLVQAHAAVIGAYSGYANAVNTLAAEILARDPQAAWIVTGGDDTEPDPAHTAEEIGAQCSTHFYSAIECAYPPSRPSWAYSIVGREGGSGENAPSWKAWSTFGVMQPTGDPFAGRQIERICGSPWMGREFCARVNGGSGPLWHEYVHMFVDEELQEVAVKLGVLWQRRDLTHKHNHFTREGDAASWAKGNREMPQFLREANSPEHWRRFSALFQARKAAGFPGHEPVPARVAA